MLSSCLGARLGRHGTGYSSARLPCAPQVGAIQRPLGWSKAPLGPVFRADKLRRSVSRLASSVDPLASTRTRPLVVPVLLRQSTPTTTAYPPSSSHQRRVLTVTRSVLHAGHSHGHHDHGHGAGTEEAQQLLRAFSNYNDPGSRITLIGMATNVLLTVVKGVGGWATHSASLLADAAHSLSDLMGDLVTLFTFKMARRPADRKYPFGYGRFEPIGTLSVSGFLIATSIGIGHHSLELLYPLLPDVSIHLHTLFPNLSAEFIERVRQVCLDTLTLLGQYLPSAHDHHAGTAHAVVDSATATAGGNGTPTPLHSSALWFVGISVVAKEALYQATMRVGLRLNSQVLVANAWHHRSDAYSSLIAAAAILGSRLGMPILDPLGGLVVAVVLAKNGASVGWEALQELVDRAAESTAKVTDQVENLLKGKDDNLDGRDGEAGARTLATEEAAMQARAFLSECCELAGVKAQRNGPHYRIRVVYRVHHQPDGRMVGGAAAHTTGTVSTLLAAQTLVQQRIRDEVKNVQEVVVIWEPTKQGDY